MSGLNPICDGNNDKATANLYEFFDIDIAAFDYYYYIYKKELEQIDTNEEKEIKEGMNEISSGKYTRFSSTQEYLKYLENNK